MAHPSHPSTPPRSSRPTPNLSSPVTPPLPETPHTSLPTPNTVRQPARRLDPIPAKNDMSNDHDMDTAEEALASPGCSDEGDNDEVLVSEAELRDMQKAAEESSGADRDKLAGMVRRPLLPALTYSSSPFSLSTQLVCRFCCSKLRLSRPLSPLCNKSRSWTRL